MRLYSHVTKPFSKVKGGIYRSRSIAVLGFYTVWLWLWAVAAEYN